MAEGTESLREPYLGIRPFKESDADLFFGRRADVRHIRASLLTSRLTTLYGPTGVGKSSLIYAGLAPVLRTSGDTSLAMVREWSIMEDPARDVLYAVAESLESVATSIESFTIEKGDYVAALEGLLDSARYPRVSLILDQFEDYFLYHEKGGGFDSFLPDILDRSDLDFHIMLVLREDNLALLDRFEGSIPSIFDNILRVEPISADGARDAIRLPLETFNRAYESSFEVEPELVERLIRDLLRPLESGTRRDPLGRDSAVPESQPIELTELQLVMQRLWRDMGPEANQISVRRYEELGGRDQIVWGHVKDVMNTLSEYDQGIAATLFEHLVTPSGRKIAHAPEDLARWTRKDLSDVERVLGHLADEKHRIVRHIGEKVASEGGGAQFEIYHDILASHVGSWRKDYESQHARDVERRSRWEASIRNARAVLREAPASGVQKGPAEQSKERVQHRTIRQLEALLRYSQSVDDEIAADVRSELQRAADRDTRLPRKVKEEARSALLDAKDGLFQQTSADLYAYLREFCLGLAVSVGAQELIEERLYWYGEDDDVGGAAKAAVDEGLDIIGLLEAVEEELQPRDYAQKKSELRQLDEDISYAFGDALHVLSRVIEESSQEIRSPLFKRVAESDEWQSGKIPELLNKYSKRWSPTSDLSDLDRFIRIGGVSDREWAKESEYPSAQEYPSATSTWLFWLAGLTAWIVNIAGLALGEWVTDEALESFGRVKPWGWVGLVIAIAGLWAFSQLDMARYVYSYEPGSRMLLFLAPVVPYWEGFGVERLLAFPILHISCWFVPSVTALLFQETFGLPHAWLFYPLVIVISLAGFARLRNV